MNSAYKEFLLKSSRPLRAEKDLLECLILDSLFDDINIQSSCVLSGSGSLTKCYGIGDRIGKDIDLAYTEFDELPETRSSKQLNKFKTRFKDMVFNDLTPKVKTAIKPIGNFTVYTDRELRDRSLAYRLATGLRSQPELHLFYKSMLSSRYNGYISIEFIPRHYSVNMIEQRTIKPYSFNQALTSAAFPTISYAQTFWDKCYALHLIAQLGAIRSGLSHHYYDVEQISNYVDIKNTQHCLTDVVRYQTIYTMRNNVIQPTSAYDIQLMPSPNTLNALSKDYKTIATTFINRQEKWNDVVKKIQLLNNQMHQINIKD